VATTPENPNPGHRKPIAKAVHDYSLDPLPVPDAIESSTDTAWSLWEHTLRSFEDGVQNPERSAENKTGDKVENAAVDKVQPGFEDTEVSALTTQPAKFQD
jgi:hypothetical protein